MTSKIYRSAQGKSIDLGTIMLQNETVRAVGNMKVNARGDKLDNNNLKRKMKTSIPKIVSNPVEIKVQFEEENNEEKDDSINISKKETLKNEEDLLEETLNNEETLNSEENFSILEKDDEWSS